MRHVLLLPFCLATLALTPRGSSAVEIRGSGENPVTFDVHGEIRDRWEVDGRQNYDPNLSTTEYNLLRSRLSVETHLPKEVSLMLQAQDSRTWGDASNTLSADGGVQDVHQGYILAENFVTPGLSLKLGRTEMAFGNERLVSRSEFSNTGRAFDAAVAHYAAERWTLDVFESKVAEGVGNPARGRDHDFFGVWATIAANPTNNVDVFALFDMDQDTLATGEDRSKLSTFGGRLAGTASSLHYEGEVALQIGNKGAADVSANLFAASVGYAFAHASKPIVGVGIDLLSGDGDQTDDKVKVFDTLFPDGHAFNGLMNYFVDIPVDTRGAGLMDLYLKATAQPTPRLGTSLWFHSFKSAEDLEVASATGGTESLSAFGSELDLVADVTCTEEVSVQGLFATFFPGEIFEKTRGGGDTALWAYFQATVGF